MLNKSTIKRIIAILKKDCKRALKIKVPGFQRPYFCSFLLRDIQWFNTWSSSGSMYRKKSDHTRNVYCDLRVGSYRFDQVIDGGLLDNDKEVESYDHVQLPIDDKCYDGMRIALWKLTEAKYREAVTDYNNKKTASISVLNPNKGLPSFVKTKPILSLNFKKREYIDEEKWVKFCKDISKWLSELPKIYGNYVEFDASSETKIFVSTEGSVIVQQNYLYCLNTTIRRLTPQGIFLEQEVTINRATIKELPSKKQFKDMLKEKFSKIEALSYAKKIPSFSGPVLLYPEPAGVLLHEALGHRLEGSRLLASGEGQTFKGQIGKKIFNIPIDIYDDPTIKKFNGVTCIGSYLYDDEGIPAKRASLIKDGKLQGFLNTRASIGKKNNYELNGHARNKKYERPISRMAVFVVEGKETYSIERLKEMLIEEIKKQNKPFGLIVYNTSGGETETTSYDFQGFCGEISYATLVSPDGKETPINGVDFVGTPLQAINNIIAVGEEKEIVNSFCGAESGFLPITTISPAILLSNLELQSKEEELLTQTILPKPVLSKKI